MALFLSCIEMREVNPRPESRGSPFGAKRLRMRLFVRLLVYGLCAAVKIHWNRKQDGKSENVVIR